MSIATDSNTAMPAGLVGQQAASTSPGVPSPRSAGSPLAGAQAAGSLAARPQADNVASSVAERALAETIQDASRIGELLDVLRSARLWLPLPDGDGRPVSGADVTLPVVSYLGSDFVPAYTSADLLRQAVAPGGRAVVPHAVVRAADLARLLPPRVGIALNAGAGPSVPVYPQAVAYLAAETDDDCERISVGPLPVRPDGLLADIAAGLLHIAAVREASAAWISVRFGGEGLLICVTLDDPADGAARDAVVGAVERAAWQAAPQDAAFAMDVTFAGEFEPDRIDEGVAAFATPFYRR